MTVMLLLLLLLLRLLVLVVSRLGWLMRPLLGLHGRRWLGLGGALVLVLEGSWGQSLVILVTTCIHTVKGEGEGRRV